MIGFVFHNPILRTMDLSNETLLTREPAVCGQFYPESPGVLKSELLRLFDSVKPGASDVNTLAIISPHAGYIYSGHVAAAAFMQLDPEASYENIFLIGSSHRYSFDGASVYTQGHYKTPLGVVPVNIKLSHQLMSLSDVFSDSLFFSGISGKSQPGLLRKQGNYGTRLIRYFDMTPIS